MKKNKQWVEQQCYVSQSCRQLKLLHYANRITFLWICILTPVHDVKTGPLNQYTLLQFLSVAACKRREGTFINTNCGRSCWTFCRPLSMFFLSVWFKTKLQAVTVQFWNFSLPVISDKIQGNSSTIQPTSLLPTKLILTCVLKLTHT